MMWISETDGNLRSERDECVISLESEHAERRQMLRDPDHQFSGEKTQLEIHSFWERDANQHIPPPQFG